MQAFFYPLKTALPSSSLFSHLSWWRPCEPTRSWWTCCHRLNWSQVLAAIGETTRGWEREREFIWELSSKASIHFFTTNLHCAQRSRLNERKRQYKSDYNIYDSTWHTTGNCDLWTWRPSMPKGKTAANASTHPTAVMLFR